MARKRRYSDSELLGPAPQDQGILRKTAGLGLSGLSAVGNLLDVPGSMARDVIGGVSTGNWKKYNPVDQLLTPFHETNRVRGRDLGRDLGLIGKKDSIGNWWGGLGLEIATDPLTYLGGAGIAKTLVGGIAKKAGIHGLGAAKIATAAGKAGKLSAVGTDAARAAKAGSWFDPARWNWVGPREANVLTPGHIQEFAPEMFDILKTTAAANKFDLAAHMNSPLGGLGTVWPLGQAGVFGMGKTGQKIARGLDVAGDLLRHGKIPGTTIRPVGDIANLVSKKAGGARNAEDLQTAYHGFQYREAKRAETKLWEAKWTNDLKRIGHSDTDSLTVRDWFEFTEHAPAEAQPLVHEVRQFIDKIPDLAAMYGVKIGDVTPKMRAAGSQASYFMRHLAEGLTGRGPGLSKKLFDPATMAEQARLSFLHGSKGGTKAIAEMAMDKELEALMPTTHGGKWSSEQRAAAEQYIAEHYGHNLPAKFLSTKQYKWLEAHGYEPTVAEAERLSRGLKVTQPLGKTPAEELQNINDWLYHADPSHKDYNRLSIRAQLLKSELAGGEKTPPNFIQAYPSRRGLAPKDTYSATARWLSKLSPEARQSGVFANHPVNDFAASAVATMDKIHASKIALERMVDAVVPAGADTVPIKNLFGRSGIDLDAEKALGYLASKGVSEKAHIPAETAQFLTQMHEGFQGGGKELHGMVKLYDDIANITKTMFTNADPIRFNVRNRASGYIANLLDGLDWFMSGHSKNADKLIRGGAIQGAAQNPYLLEEAAKRGIQGLDDKRATEILAEMLYAHEATGSYGMSDAVQHGASNIGAKLDDITQAIPGGHPFSWGNLGNQLKGEFGTAGTTLNPFTSYRGVRGATETKNAWVKAGEGVSHYAESMNRIAPVWAMMQNGVHPNEAIRRMLEAQVAYQGRFYTKFEQQILKRALLFYSFAKGQLPFSLRQLSEKPGGPLAQTLRAINRGKSEDELVPQHVAETASIPVDDIPGLGSPDQGTKSYLTGFGMGFEDPAQFAVPSMQNFGMEALSRANPLIKAPLEAAFGASTFQRAPGGGGRSLEDLDPVLGRTLANIGNITGLRESKAPVRYPGSSFVEHLLSNSPVSNIFTKARTITDPRKSIGAKAANLLTGIKVTDISPAAQDAELRNRVGQIEKQMGGKVYVDTYLPADVKAGLSPKEAEAYMQIQALRQLLEARSKKRKETKK